MKILAIEQELPGASAEKFRCYAKEEARKAWKLYQSGFIREMYFRADRNEAVLMVECASGNEALEILSTLPFVQNKLITFEIIPLQAYSGFERLFA